MRFNRFPLYCLLLAGSLLLSTGCSTASNGPSTSQSEVLTVQYTGQVTTVEGHTVTLALVEMSSELERQPSGEPLDRDRGLSPDDRPDSDSEADEEADSAAIGDPSAPTDLPHEGGPKRDKIPADQPDREEGDEFSGRGPSRPGGGWGGLPMGNVQLTGETVTLTLTDATTYDLGPQEEQRSTLVEGDWVQVEAQDGTALAVSSLWNQRGRRADGDRTPPEGQDVPAQESSGTAELDASDPEET